MTVNDDPGIVDPLEQIGRGVRTAIVHDDELDPDRHGEHAPDDLADRGAFQFELVRTALQIEAARNGRPK